MVVRDAIGLRPWEGEREPSGLTPADVPRVPELDLLPVVWDDLRRTIPAEGLTTPLLLVDLPKTMGIFCNRRGIQTIGDLVQWKRLELLCQHNVGRGTVNRTFEAIAEAVFSNWSDHPRQSTEPEVTWRKDLEEHIRWGRPVRWDVLHLVVPPSLATAPLSIASLPTRMMTFARSRNIETVGELLLLRRADLLLAPGIGVKTIEESAAAITQWMKVVGEEGIPPLLQANGVPPEFRIQVFDDFGSLWTSRGSALSSTDRRVVSRRSGISAAAETLARIGEDLGVTRERVRQIEARALEQLKADGRWIDALSEKLSAAREGRARAAEELSRDPFWASLFAQESGMRFIFRNFLEHTHALVWWNRGWVVTDAGTGGLEGVFRRFLMEKRSFPMRAEELIAEAQCVGERIGRGWGDLFEGRLGEHFKFDEAKETVLGQGTSKWDRIRTFLVESPGPVPLAVLEAKFGRMSSRPDDVLVVLPGVLTVPGKIEGFEEWERRLVALCLRLMNERGSGLPWTASYLFVALQDVVELPGFMTPSLLACMLRRSKVLADLKGQRFSLPRSSGQGTRVSFTRTLVGILEEAGEPMGFEELRRRLEERVTVPELALRMAVTQPPLLRLASNKVGLLDRDVPGGEAAVLEAAESIEALLEERGRGLSFRGALLALRDRSSRFSDWTLDPVRALPRIRPAITSNRSGLGLSRWGEVRLPPRSSIIWALVDEGGGKALVSEVIDHMEELQGVRLSRTRLASITYHLGLRIRGDTVVAGSLP